MGMNRRAEDLVRQIRRQTDNKQLGNDDGINTEEILQYLNDGQEIIQEAVIVTHPHIFVVDDTVDTVPNQEEYENPPLAYGNQGLIRVDFAYGGPPDDYRPLKKVTIFEERTYRGTTPWQYIPKSGGFFINPVPDAVFTSGLRRWYNKIVPRLDVTRSKVSAVTVTSGEITALTLDASYPAWGDGSLWTEDEYLCICDRDGNIKTRSIPYDAVDPSTGDVTLPANHVLLDGESVAVDDFVVRGWYASTHSELAHFCEKYLIEYGSWRVFKRDESKSLQVETAILLEMKNSIVEVYGEINADIDRIPAIDYDYSEYL